MAAATAAQRGVVPVRPSEPAEMKRLSHLLQAGPRAVGATKRTLPKLVGSNNEEMPLPEAIYDLLVALTPRLLRGESVVVIPEDAPLTTQQAADLLGMSRPFLKRLLDADVIAYYRVGTHRRLRFADVMDYKERREAERQKQMDDLLDISDEMGVYE